MSNEFITREEYQRDMEEIKKALSANTMMTAETSAVVTTIKEDTAGIVEIFGAISGGVKILGAMGKMAVWLTKLAAAGTLIYSIFKFGVYYAIHGKFPTP